MTKRELASYFECSYACIDNAFYLAFKKYPELKKNKPTDNYIHIDYTFDEVSKVLPYFCKKLSPIQIALLKDNFIDHGGTVFDTRKQASPYIKGMENYLNSIQKCNFIKCCESCVYIIAKSIRNRDSHLYPFCSFYNRFLTYRNAVDIFHDYCKTYEYKKREPIIWYKKDAPDTGPHFVNGIDPDNVIHI